MRIHFIGDISKDFNVIRGQTREEPGGGVFHNSMTAAAIGADVVAVITCAPEDRGITAPIAAKNVPIVFCGSGRSTTTIENVYPDENPDSRRSRLIAGATPFEPGDFDAVSGGVIHVNPLWYPLFSMDILAGLRQKAELLAADAQGFLRNIAADGSMYLKVPPDVERGLALLDVLKVDIKEAAALTGIDDVEPAARAVRAMGPRIVVLTHADGVCVFDGSRIYEAPFGKYPMEGRTGRGDTCSAAFLCALARGGDTAAATEFAGRITSSKLQYPGPYRGD
ncbi:MAG TPA: PfkB family carbohydrate kinase [Myxococcota bacterium]|nr:PfkB family carbohydrate kinase [Myxococcota bacterium]HOA12767.1 PfkB family carbohydrate kinase [Myxococcota bacterium]HOC99433.1 PfkB family carbohydrate kinase [Myxococcota bacterium]HOH77935.1 PfkB family carbohydrate kinase [Myxococcota bacterium]HPV05091.1 PfkB family carbohydrate kinase [Myxococcota bacterium]